MSLRCILPPVPICGTNNKRTKSDDRPFPEDDYKVFPRENLYDRIILPGKLISVDTFREEGGSRELRNPNKSQEKCLPDLVRSGLVPGPENCLQHRLSPDPPPHLKEVKKPGPSFLSVPSGDSSEKIVRRARDPDPSCLEPCNMKIILQTIALNGLDKDRPPPLPPRRGSFPQCRTLSVSFSPSPLLSLAAGQQLLLTGISHRPNRFLVQLEGRIFHIPFNYFI